jgi:methionyl-tRNA formyltransferase
VPTLSALLASRHEIVAVVSQPDRPRGRGRKQLPSPVSERALAAGVLLLRPERVGDPAVVTALAQARPDIGVVVAFGQFMPRVIRELPRLGYCINAHASLLPRYRGAAPIAQAILDGQPSTGISVMRVEREMDAGPVALVRETPIGEQENAAELTDRLARLAADALLEALEQIAAGKITWTEQDASHASVAPKLSKLDGRLDFARSARELVCRVHGLAPRPGAYATLPAEDGPPEVLRILRARARPATGEALPVPGTVRRSRDSGTPPLLVATGDGWLEPIEVQRAGGKAMDTAAYLRGHDLADGTILSAADETSR